MNCWKCKQPGATVPDPCCGAPDCENTGDYAHPECSSDSRLLRRQEETYSEDERPRKERTRKIVYMELHAGAYVLMLMCLLFAR